MPVPTGFNWDYWLGQAPQVDYLKERCHQTFRWWFDYSGGTVTDWGAHHNDIARWAIGLDGPDQGPGAGADRADSWRLSRRHPSSRRRSTWANGVTQIVKTTVDDSPFGVALKPDGQRNGVRFEGSDGWIWVNRTTITASNQELLDTPLTDAKVKLEVSDDHMGNFFEAMRSRKDPICPVEGGHQSAVVGHLIVIALRTGQHAAVERGQGEVRGRGGRRKGTPTSSGACASPTTTASPTDPHAARGTFARST